MNFLLYLLIINDYFFQRETSLHISPKKYLSPSSTTVIIAQTAPGQLFYLTAIAAGKNREHSLMEGGKQLKEKEPPSVPSMGCKCSVSLFSLQFSFSMVHKDPSRYSIGQKRQRQKVI